MASPRTDLAYAAADNTRVDLTKQDSTVVLTAELPNVLPGSIIETRLSGSAIGQFYFSAEPTPETAANVARLCYGQGKLTTDPNNRALVASFAASALFRFTGSSPQKVAFTVQFQKKDLTLTTPATITGLTLIARII